MFEMGILNRAAKRGWTEADGSHRDRSVLLLIALLLGLSIAAGCNRTPSSSPGGDSGGRGLMAESPEAALEAHVDRLEGVIGRRGALSNTLARVADLPDSILEPWIRALGEVLDLRRLRPEDRVLVELVAGSLRRIELRRSVAERYEAVRTADGQLTARRVPVESERRMRHLAGEVETSLNDAMLAAGGSSEIVARVADILAYDIDFFTDPRPGDRFDVLIDEEWVEGQRIGGATILFARYEGQRASQTGYRFTDSSEHADYYDVSGSSLRKALLKSPLNYRRVSSHFSHAPIGTPVVSVGDGKVTYAGYKGANGNLVKIRHGNGYETYYLHLRKVARGVRRGKRVTQGQVIGWVGSSGASTGPHLDFRVKHHGKFKNPLKLTLPPGPPVAEASRQAYASERARLLGLVGLIPPGEVVATQELARLTAHREQIEHAAAAGRYRF
jgi:murein DD-endopeptidase MepM/ murein hydrolase activator NlpD